MNSFQQYNVTPLYCTFIGVIVSSSVQLNLHKPLLRGQLTMCIYQGSATSVYLAEIDGLEADKVI